MSGESVLPLNFECSAVTITNLRKIQETAADKQNYIHNQFKHLNIFIITWLFCLIFIYSFTTKRELNAWIRMYLILKSISKRSFTDYKFLA